MKKAFTLIELLVVVGIIGILVGMMLTSFSGGTESARAAKCLSNMRNLVQAATTCAAEHASHKANLPFAGSYFGVTSGTKNDDCAWHIGWISWLDMGFEHDSVTKIDNINVCCEDEIKATYAITNGTLWRYVNQDMGAYVCPEHKVRAAKYGAKARLSYVMNAFFLYDKAPGVVGGGYAWDSGSAWGDPGMPNTERLLMFAEVPFGVAGSSYDKANATFCPPKGDAKARESGARSLYQKAKGQGEPLLDCVLQYKARYNGRGYHTEWGGEPEAIAFNHKNGKRWCAHVAFCDGHTEKLALVEEGKRSELDAYQLTALLCEGVAVIFDGAGYSMPRGADVQNDDYMD